MAKGRMIHTRIWRSEKLSGYDPRVRLLWIGLITNADDQGRGRAHPGLVRSDVFPLEDVPLSEIEGALHQFAADGMLILYQDDVKALYQVANWWDYQGSMTWAWPSDFAPPDGWADRVRYRRGNTVVEENWQGVGGMDDAPPDEDEPTVSPPRPQDEPAPKRAPNGNGNSNGNGNPSLTGAGAPSPPRTFQEWESALDTYTNRPALVRRMVELLYPGLDPPDYGLVGTIAKKMGRGKNGYHRLMGLLWEYSARPPQGDLLPYLLRVHQGKERDNGRARQGHDGDGAAELSEEQKAIAAAFAADGPGDAGEGA